MADTEHLTDAEHGRYLKLIMLLWRSPGCRIPNDDQWIARRLRRSPAEVQSEIRPIIVEFCSNSGNWITQKRLLREYRYVSRRAKSQSDRAKSRWNKEKSDARAYAPTPIPTPRKKEGREIPNLLSLAASGGSSRKKVLTTEEKRLAWGNKIACHLYATVPDRADAIVDAWQKGERWAKDEFDRADRLLRANGHAAAK